LYRVNEKNSQEKNAHPSAQLGNDARREDRFDPARSTATHHRANSIAKRMREKPHEYWRFHIARKAGTDLQEHSVTNISAESPHGPPVRARKKSFA